jgi:hypothetical protein
VNVDDIEITDFGASTPTIVVSPSNLSFGGVPIQTTSPEKTLNVTGYNLTGNITYTKSGADAAAFTITQTSWNPAAGGTLSVTFTPTEARASSASIVFNSAGATDKTVTLSGTGIAPSDNFFEDFEDLDGAESTNYSGKEMTFASGEWYIKGVTSMDANDRYNGTRSIRLRGNATDEDHRAEMMFDKPNGAGTVSFKYGSYSAHTGGELQLQISTDQGATWVDKGEAIAVPSWVDGGSVLQTAEIEVNQDGDIRIRVLKSNAKATSSVNVDDIEITDFGTSLPSISVSPTFLAFGNVEIQTISPEKTVNITGHNLSGNITYTKSGTDAAAFTIREVSWNPATGGTLGVTFAPTAERAYSATITLSSPGAESKVVSLTGTGIILGNFFEDFEDMTGGGSYEGEEVTFATGVWFIKGYTKLDANDRYNGTRSIRLRGNTTDEEHRAEMMFDKPNGAGTVSFKYASYSAHANGVIQLQISTDQGATWHDKGEALTVPSWVDGGSTLLTAEIEINQPGNIRIRILKTNAKANSSVNIDDIEITHFGNSIPDIPAAPTVIVYPNPTTGELRIESV